MATAPPGSDRSRWEGVMQALGDLLATPSWTPDEAALVLFAW